MDRFAALTDEELLDLYEEAWRERIEETPVAPMDTVEGANLEGPDQLYAEIERRGLVEGARERGLTPPEG